MANNILQLFKACMAVLLYCLSSFTFSIEADRFIQYTTEDGLAHNRIRKIIQDNQGLMWFATQNGISRFDGYEFINYYAVPHSSDTLSNKEIYDITIDSSDIIWLATAAGGLNRFNPKTQSITVFQHNKNDKYSVRSNQINCLYLENEKKLWIGTNLGLDLYNIEDRTFSHIDLLQTINNSTSKLGVYKIIQIKNKLWIATSSGLFIYNIINGDTILAHTLQQESTNTTFIHSLHYSGNNKLWIGTNKGLFIVNPDSLNIEKTGMLKERLKSHRIHDIAEDSQKNIWIATNNGVFQINNSYKVVREFKMNPHTEDTLNDHKITALYIDPKQNLWLGTSVGGVNKLSYRSILFGLERQLSNQNQLKDNYIKYIFEDYENNLWIQNRVAVQRYNPQTNKYDNPIGHENIFEDMHSISGFNNDIWISTHTQGLFQYNLKTHTMRHRLFDNTGQNNVTSNHIHYLIPDGERLWIDNLNGLLIYEPLTDDFKPFTALRKISDIYSPGYINDIHTDSYGFTWVASYKGLLQFKNNSLIKHHYYKKNYLQGLNDNTVYDIHEDQSRQLWIATKSGLQKYNYTNDTFSSTHLNHLTSGAVLYSVVNDNSNRLWIGTNKGLVVYNPENNATIIYRQAEGLQGNDFSVKAKSLLRNGQLAFGGVNGFNIFNPDMIINTDSPDVYISKIKFDDSIFSYYTDDFYKIPYENNNISLTLSTLDYHNPQANRYSYKLEGYHNKWIEQNAENRMILLTNLDPGHYVFKAKTRNNNHIWSNEKKLFELNITVPWWLSYYAYTAYILLISAFIYGVIRLKTYNLNKKSQLLEKIIHERTQKIREQHDYIEHQNSQLESLVEKKDKTFINISHEFRTPLTLILGPLKNLSKMTAEMQQESIAMIQGNAYRLLRLVNQLLSLSKIRAEKNSEINTSQCFSKQLVEIILPSFQSLAKDKNITLKVESNHTCLVACSYDDLEKIISNLLSNAIKYTLANGNINLSITNHNKEYCKIVVEDTGIGIAPEHIDHVFEAFTRIDNHQHSSSGTGIGLALVKELVESLRGNICLESQLGHGSRFTITLPLFKGNLQIPTPNYNINDELNIETVNLTQHIQQEDQSATQTINKKISLNDKQPLLLIIEDNSDMQQYLQRLCNPHFQCLLAKNGKEGSDLAIEHIPDIILSDIMMPEMDGHESLQIIKGDRRTCHIPVILLTALNDMDNKIRALKENADDVLTKPFYSEELLARLKNTLSIRQLIKDSNTIPKPVKLKELDKLFLDHFKKVLEKYHKDETLDTTNMAQYLLMSDRQMQRKIKALTGKNPAVHLRDYRLERSAELLNKGYRVEDVAYEVGFAYRNYYSKCFKDRYGLTPKEYQISGNKERHMSTSKN